MAPNAGLRRVAILQAVTVMQKETTRVMEEFRKARQLLSVDEVFLDGAFTF